MQQVHAPHPVELRERGYVNQTAHGVHASPLLKPVMDLMTIVMVRLMRVALLIQTEMVTKVMSIVMTLTRQFILMLLKVVTI
jgi:hypothetical protein